MTLLPSFAGTQEIPKGVRYKRTSSATNQAAARLISEALSKSQGDVGPLFDRATICGPMLWRDIEGTAGKTLLNAKPAAFITSVGGEGIVAVGKNLRDASEQRAFWQVLLAKFPALKVATVRAAKPDEILYYWALISFDIEEPFLTIEAPSVRLVVGFQVRNGQPALTWIDRVDDLRLLRAVK